MDAANVDLKGFTDDFYHKLCAGHLQPVLDTLVYLKHETQCWLEITTLLIPGQNDSDAGNHRAIAVDRQGTGAGRAAALLRLPSRLQDDGRPGHAGRHAELARATSPWSKGLHYVYTGNVHDPAGDTTFCPNCQAALIVRDWYQINAYHLTTTAIARTAAPPSPGASNTFSGQFGRQQIPVAIHRHA